MSSTRRSNRRTPTRSRRWRASARTHRRSRSSRCRRQSPAGAGDDRRGQRVRGPQGQARQRGGHPGARDVAEQDALDRALAIARALHRVVAADRPVWPTATLAELRASLGGPLPDAPLDPAHVIDALARAADPGLVTTTGPRYFGFVTGGALPATVAAEWLAAAWDQTGDALCDVAGRRRRRRGRRARGCSICSACLRSCSVGFVTGCHMANFTALAAARHELLRRAGWDVEAQGLQDAPPIRILVGDEVHVSVIGALRMLGFGSRSDRTGRSGRARPDAAGGAQRMRRWPRDQREGGATIICAQAGNVNTGAFDPLDAIADLAAATSRVAARRWRVRTVGRRQPCAARITCAASSARIRAPPTRTSG